jgi:hypothetical protein
MPAAVSNASRASSGASLRGTLGDQHLQVHDLVSMSLPRRNANRLWHFSRMVVAALANKLRRSNSVSFSISLAAPIQFSGEVCGAAHCFRRQRFNR